MITIFPVGGHGQRFKDAGFITPKPFIRLGDKRVIDYVLDSYPMQTTTQKRLFVVRPEYEHEFEFGVFTINGDTSGPVETILSNKHIVELLSNCDDSILIADCDSVIERKELLNAIESFKDSGADGGVTVRHSRNSAYSYARLDTHDFVQETREKDPFTDMSTTGPYWFKSAKIFHKYASEALNDGVSSVSPVYNYLIKDNLRVKATETFTFQHLGTPDELKAFAISRGVALPQPSFN